MFLEGLLPSQHTLFEVACNALQVGNVSLETPSNTSILQFLEADNLSVDAIWELLKENPGTSIFVSSLSFLMNIFLFFGPIMNSKFILGPHFPDLKNRKAGLIGLVFMMITALGFAFCFMLMHQGFLPLPVPLFLITLFLGLSLEMSSRLVVLLEPNNSFYGMNNCIVSGSVAFIAAHVFPQQFYPTCTTESLGFTFLFVFCFGCCLTAFNSSFSDFLIVLSSEKLDIIYYVDGKKYRGYIVKEGSEWIEVHPNEV